MNQSLVIHFPGSSDVILEFVTLNRRQVQIVLSHIFAEFATIVDGNSV